MNDNSRALRCRLVLAGLLTFAIAMIASSALYPGGTWWDRGRPGHSVLGNFWCDSLRVTAHNGVDNQLGASVALGGWLLLSVTLVPFWTLCPLALRGTPRLAPWVRRLGVLSALCMGGVFLTPSDRFPVWHGIAITLAGLPGVAAITAAVAASSGPATPASIRLCGWALAALASINLGQYLNEYWCDAADARWLPAVQKMATLAALGWVTSITWHVRLQSGAAGANDAR